MNVHIIANPVAGGGKGRAMAERLRTALAEFDIVPQFSLTQRAGDAREMAAASDADCVASVGGDGTLNEVINGLGSRDVAVAVLPVGTANVVARELGVLPNAQAVARCVNEGNTRTMDVGLCQDRRFLLGAGAGLDAAIAKKVAAVRGTRSGISKWIGPAIRTCLHYTYPRIRVTVDGVTASDSAQYAIVGNCRYSAGVFPATPRADTEDGLLDVCLFHDLGPLRLAGLALRVWNPHFVEARDVVYVQGRDIVLEPRDGEAAPLQIDGDPVGFIPAHFTVLRKAVRMVVPPR